MDIRLDQRLTPRRRTAIAAEIVFHNGRSRVGCIIRNLSSFGAKLEVQSLTRLPVTFALIAPDMSPMACRTVWRSLREIGVAFR